MTRVSTGDRPVPVEAGFLDGVAFGLLIAKPSLAAVLPAGYLSRAVAPARREAESAFRSGTRESERLLGGAATSGDGRPNPQADLVELLVRRLGDRSRESRTREAIQTCAERIADGADAAVEAERLTTILSRVEASKNDEQQRMHDARTKRESVSAAPKGTETDAR